MRGKFISFEGIDGAGKSTHIEAAALALRSAGQQVVVTREPGGTALAEAIREQVLHQSMDGLTELLLVFAARRDHLNKVIAPALTRGDWVICDRFTDSTFAYQGGGRRLDLAVITQLEAWVHGNQQPDVTLLFDLPAGVAADRREKVRTADRFEAEEVLFFERVRSQYLRRAQQFPQRFTVIDAELSQESIKVLVNNILDKLVVTP